MQKILNNRTVAFILIITFIVSLAFALKYLSSRNRLSKKDWQKIEEINRMAAEEMKKMAEN